MVDLKVYYSDPKNLKQAEVTEFYKKIAKEIYWTMNEVEKFLRGSGIEDSIEMKINKKPKKNHITYTYFLDGTQNLHGSTKFACEIQEDGVMQIERTIQKKGTEIDIKDSYEFASFNKFGERPLELSTVNLKYDGNQDKIIDYHVQTTNRKQELEGKYMGNENKEFELTEEQLSGIKAGVSIGNQGVDVTSTTQQENYIDGLENGSLNSEENEFTVIEARKK